MIEKTLLPNIRWLALPSDEKGEDWDEKILKIDLVLESLGYELADESVYLIYSHSARETLSGKGQCLVARPVIGPKKNLDAPYILRDWTASGIWKKTINSGTLHDLLQATSDTQAELKSLEKQPERGFILWLRRRLTPGLALSIEAILPE